MCSQTGCSVQLLARPCGLIGIRRKFNLLLHPIIIRRLTLNCQVFFFNIHHEILYCMVFLSDVKIATLITIAQCNWSF